MTPPKTKSMSSDLKEFYELLLNNLKSLDTKVDGLQQDMSKIKSDVAVLKETKESLKQFTCHIEEFQKQMNKIDKDLAIKSSKWGVISSVATFLLALLVAYLAGILK